MMLIRAAGGVVWQDAGERARVAIIHRPRRRDWSLPKGKLLDGESWEEAALREVREETGCACRRVEFAASTWYVPNRTPKVVLFWNMVLQRAGQLDAGEEVDEVRWLEPRAAMERLDHENERRALQRAMARREARLRSGRPDAVALAIASARGRLLRRGLTEAIDGETLGNGLARLDRAEDALFRGHRKARAHLEAAGRIADRARAD